ncbi:MAG: SAM-dependent methyltransferase [Silicimonas sp.]|nr:SAM-dependent methyltransferase [Silicimonas sp.]
MNGTPKLTDRSALAAHRTRAASAPTLFLHEEAAVEVEERLADIKKSFTSPALIGHVTDPITQLFPHAPLFDDAPELSLTQNAHDLVLHAFGLHWADDLVGQLVQSRLALRPDGLFLGVMFGGATLSELRAALAEAETRVTGGLSPRILPMADLRDLGGLLQRAGLALPVADSRRITVRYPDLATLICDLRGMGETNAMVSRHRKMPPRKFFSEAESVYRQNFSDEGYLLATFELVFLTGWAPSDTQQKPLAPGSARTRLADALGVQEIETGDKARR